MVFELCRKSESGFGLVSYARGSGPFTPPLLPLEARSPSWYVATREPQEGFHVTVLCNWLMTGAQDTTLCSDHRE